MNGDLPDYIVVEGPIGAGKTSLAKRLAQTYEIEPVLESAADNPFLPAFYDNPRASALPVQLYFLFQRVRQLELLRQSDMFRPVCIADYLIEKDRLFAKATLTEAEFELYQQVYDHMAPETPAPDLVIYLQASPETLLKRILERGIHYEKGIDEGYLKKITDAYVDFFYHYDAAPLLIVNTENFDLAHGENSFNLLLDHIRKLTRGRHYFNPHEL